MADYQSLLMRAVANLPNAGTPATRGVLYERARKALLEQLRSLRPPLPESDITREETALDAAIAEIEERYKPQDPASPPASGPQTPTPPAARKADAAPAKAAPPPPPPKFAGVQRPAAPPAPGPATPPARSPSQTGSPVQPGIASAPVQAPPQRPSPSAQERGQPTGSAATGANPGCGTASRDDPGGGFAGSIAAGCRDGQSARLRIEERPDRSTRGGKGQG